LIDSEIRKLLSESHERVRETILGRRATLDALAKLLCEREVVDRAALESITGGALLPA
jgi:cell division protease FtsH